MQGDFTVSSILFGWPELLVGLALVAAAVGIVWWLRGGSN
jgi:hypothetical protein